MTGLVEHSAVTVSVTFTKHDAGDRITRSSGSWLADGFKAGDVINISETGNNNSSFRIAGITDSTLTLTVKNSVTAETVDAKLVVTETPVSTLAQVGDGVSITAGGDFALTADSDHDVAEIGRAHV